MSKHPKADMYMADLDLGMTYREIAEKYGISRQAVYVTCTKVGGAPSFKIITQTGCIWPNLRAWLNADRERQKQFFRAFEGCSIRDCLKGIRQPKKHEIDKMLSITGMTYEFMFAEE